MKVSNLWPLVGVIVAAVLLWLSIWELDWRYLASAPICFFGIPAIGMLVEAILFPNDD